MLVPAGYDFITVTVTAGEKCFDEAREMPPFMAVLVIHYVTVKSQLRYKI